MNISYNWLKELIDIDLSPDETAAALTRVGLAVEGIHPFKDDLVLDIDLTSNRSDCLSHLGIAREIGVIQNSQLKIQNSKTEEPKAKDQNLVTIEDSDLCHRFTARVIRGVKVGPSPQWLVDRLEALGERSINNIADITNFVMLELGQPMHAFDLDKLAENRLVVRRARAGERITTLDEMERELDDTMLAICDAGKPVAVAGIMGGFDSGISDSTINVLLEVAYFDRSNIRATSRKLKFATEASYRFERGVDIDNLVRASNRATDLILELAGGTAEDVVEIYPTPHKAKHIESKDISSAVERLTGLKVNSLECDRILNALGILKSNESAIRNSQSAIYLSPTWRHDIAIEEDLVEEIARHAGYENIADELPPAFGAGEYQPNEGRERRVRELLTNFGYFEVLNYSFIDEGWDDVFMLVPTIDGGNVTLQDAIIDGAVRMRRTLLPGLLNSIRENFNQQRRDLSLFEIGKVFTDTAKGELPTERKLFAMAITGDKIYESRSATGGPVDLFDLKGHFEAVVTAAGIPELSFSAAEIKHLQPGQAASISYGSSQIGSIGRLANEIAAKMKFKQPVYIAEVDLNSLMDLPETSVVYKPLPKFPGVVRDVSFIVRRSFEFGELEHVIGEANEPLLVRFSFVDSYQGKGISDDERSLTLRFEYRSDERTLAEADVEASHQALLQKVKETLGIEPRF